MRVPTGTSALEGFIEESWMKALFTEVQVGVKELRGDGRTVRKGWHIVGSYYYKSGIKAHSEESVSLELGTVEVGLPDRNRNPKPT